jgi:spore maturation protein CgeB
MNIKHLRTVIVGLSITSTWENSHAAAYRSLVRELTARGHDILFLERNAPWYAENRDLPVLPHCEVELYCGLEDLRRRFTMEIRRADCVIIGSSVPDGVAVGEWITAVAPGITVFYDFDTPLTIAKVEAGDCDYLSPDLIAQYDLYFSSSGGQTLDLLEQTYQTPRAKPLHGSFDAQLYYPEDQPIHWDLGYIGGTGEDREPYLEKLMLDAASRWREGRFAVAGFETSGSHAWPKNVERLGVLPADGHRRFYNSLRFTLDTASADMVRAGYSPSRRLFEAAACGCPIITEYWEGLEQFFEPGREILISRSPRETLTILRDIPEAERIKIGEAALRRVNRHHTATHRAVEVDVYIYEALYSYAKAHYPVSDGLCAWRDWT